MLYISIESNFQQTSHRDLKTAIFTGLTYKKRKYKSIDNKRKNEKTQNNKKERKLRARAKKKLSFLFNL